MALLRLVLLAICSPAFLSAIPPAEIHEAAKTGNLAAVRTILEKDASLVNARDETGRTALHWAARGTNAELIAYLLEKGADVNTLDNNGTAPLHAVASRGNMDAIRILLAKGADIHIAAADRNTPLHLSAQAGQVEAVRLLVALGADIERVNGHGRTPLVLAAREMAGAPVVAALMDLGAKIDSADASGNTALSFAAWRGSADVVTLLLARNASVPINGLTARQLLGYAVSKGLTDLFARMAEKGADVTIDDNGNTLLHGAAEGGSVRVLEILLSKGLDINRKDANGWTPLHFAVDMGRGAAVDLLLAKGANLTARTTMGQSAYNVAEDNDDRDMMALLAGKGADRSPARFPELAGPYLGQKAPGKTPEVFARGLVSARYGLHGNVVFSPDGKAAFWSLMIPPRTAGYGGGRTMLSRLVNGRWTYPRRAVYGGTPLEDVPCYHPDGTRLYDMAQRPLPGGRAEGKENIWVWDKSADGWRNPRPLDASVNELPQHWQFAVDRDANVYFSTSIAGSLGGGDIYVSRLVGGRYQKPENLGSAVNTTADEGLPFVAPDGSYLLFGRDGDIYVSFGEKDGHWGAARPLGREINTPGMQLAPIVSPDGKYLFYLDNWRPMWVDAAVIEDARRRDAR